MNQSMIEHAARIVRRTLERAARGDEEAQRDLLRYAVAEALETKLTRIAALADQCAPSLEALKTDASPYSLEAQHLRFEVDQVGNLLNQAAGRAVVLEMPARGGEAPTPLRETFGDPRDDNCELPKPLPAFEPEPMR